MGASFDTGTNECTALADTAGVDQTPESSRPSAGGWPLLVDDLGTTVMSFPGEQSAMADDVDEDSEPDIVRASIEPDPKTAEHDLLELIAESEGVEIEDLPSFYEQVDHFVEMLFKRPPSSESQMQLSFSYAGYRVTVNQKGEVTLLNVKRSMVDE